MEAAFDELMKIKEEEKNMYDPNKEVYDRIMEQNGQRIKKEKDNMHAYNGIKPMEPVKTTRQREQGKIKMDENIVGSRINELRNNIDALEHNLSGLETRTEVALDVININLKKLNEIECIRSKWCDTVNAVLATAVDDIGILQCKVANLALLDDKFEGLNDYWKQREKDLAEVADFYTKKFGQRLEDIEHKQNGLEAHEKRIRDLENTLHKWPDVNPLAEELLTKDPTEIMKEYFDHRFGKHNPADEPVREAMVQLKETQKEPEYFSFEVALSYYKQGKSVSRKGWCYVLHKYNTNCISFTTEDFLAKDWYIVDNG